MGGQQQMIAVIEKSMQLTTAVNDID